MSQNSQRNNIHGHIPLPIGIPHIGCTSRVIGSPTSPVSYEVPSPSSTPGESTLLNGLQRDDQANGGGQQPSQANGGGQQPSQDNGSGQQPGQENGANANAEAGEPE
ncbi:hypothetical protein EC991_005604 [Linnemannia zychae]|nr:hypothetical protein EC991_005604 [Linnemannia zychae]